MFSTIIFCIGTGFGLWLGKTRAYNWLQRAFSKVDEK